jgi:Mycothiol maleylpyruvate isomerase N-terminal domain
MSEKSENIAQLESSLTAFRAKIASLPDSAWAEHWLGTWTLNELTAHMSGWANEMAAALGRVAAGQRPTPEGVDYSDFDAWNAGFAGKAVAKAESLATFDASFKAYIEGAKALPEGLFGKTDEGKLKIGSRLLEGAGIHHFAEHGEQLDTWLAGRK